MHFIYHQSVWQSRHVRLMILILLKSITSMTQEIVTKYNIITKKRENYELIFVTLNFNILQ